MAYTDAQGNVIPDEQVAQALAQGVDVRAVEGTSTWVVDPETGARREIAAEELPDFLEWGFAPQSQQEAQQQSALEAAQDQPIQALAERTLAGATLGLSDVAARQLAPEYADEMALRQQANPGASTIGAVAGAVAPALLSGGSSLLGRAATVMPAGGLARGALATGRAAEQALVRRGVSPGLAKAAGMVAEGAIDGSLASVGDALSEASLGDTELTAERLLAAGGMGALLGAGVGGLVGTGAGIVTARRARAQVSAAGDSAVGGFVGATAGGEVGSRLGGKLGGRVGSWLGGKFGSELGERAGRKARPSKVEERLRQIREQAAAKADEVAESVASAAPTEAGVGRLIPKSVRDWASRISGVSRDDIDRVAGSRQIRSDALRRDELVQEASNRTRRGVEDMLSGDEVVRSMAAGGLKRETVARTVNASPTARDNALLRLSDFETRLNSLDHLTKADRRTLDKRISYHTSKLQSAKSDADLYIWGDEFKRDMQRQALFFQRRGRRVSDVESQSSALQVSDALNELQERNRLWLEDVDEWGEVARLQRERNAALREMIDNGRDFRRIFTERSGESADPDLSDAAWMFEKSRGNGKGIKDFFNRALTDDDADLVREQVLRHLNARKHLIETLQRNGEVPAQHAARFEKAHTNVSQLIQDIDSMSQRLKDADLLHAMIAKEQGSPLSGGALIGAAAGGIPGAAVGAAAGAVARPGSTLMRLAKLEAMWGAQQSAERGLRGRVSRAVGRWLGGGKRKGAKGTGRRRAARPVVAAGATTLVFGDSRKERRESYDAVTQRVQDYQRNPEALVQVAQAQTQEFSDVAPAAAAMLAQKQALALSFLASKLPAPGQHNGNLLQPHLAPKPFIGPREIDQMELYVRAVADPMVALDDLEQGTLRPETVEAVRAVWPALYREMQQAFVEELSTTTEELPYQAMLQTGLLLGVPAHPTMTPQFVQGVQQLYREQAEQAAQPPPPSQQAAPDYAANTKTLSQQTVEALGG